MNADELYDGLVDLCRGYGFTNDETYAKLHEAIDTITLADDLDDDDASPLRFNDHTNDIGDWCPWSHCSASVKDDVADEDRSCPAGCRGSYVEPE